MEKKQQYQLNLSAPNLLNICVDQSCNGNLSGRLYHCYAKEAVAFSSLVELLRDAEQLFDRISFPQASTKTRSFIETDVQTRQLRPEKVVEQKEIIQHTGELGTFVTHVKFRQNSTWQGELFWIEKEIKKSFSNALDFIKLIDHALAVV